MIQVPLAIEMAFVELNLAIVEFVPVPTNPNIPPPVSSPLTFISASQTTFRFNKWMAGRVAIDAQRPGTRGARNCPRQWCERRMEGSFTNGAKYMHWTKHGFPVHWSIRLAKSPAASCQ